MWSIFRTYTNITSSWIGVFKYFQLFYWTIFKVNFYNDCIQIEYSLNLLLIFLPKTHKKHASIHYTNGNKPRIFVYTVLFMIIQKQKYAIFHWKALNDVFVVVENSSFSFTVRLPCMFDSATVYRHKMIPTYPVLA